MDQELKIGDRVIFNRKSTNPNYNPGVGTVRRVGAKVIVEWDKWPGKLKHNYYSHNLKKLEF